MTLTPLQEVNLHKKQAEVQIEDAMKRNVVWAAEGEVEGDPDATIEDYGKVFDSNPVPIGVRHEGIIRTLPVEASLEEAQYGGVSERVPTKLQEMVCHESRDESMQTNILLSGCRLYPRQGKNRGDSASAHDTRKQR